MNRNILNNDIIYINNLEQFIEVKKATIEIGEFIEPNYYYILRYSQRCPRGCCYDDVCEILTKEEYISELKENIGKYCDELKKVRELNER